MQGGVMSIERGGLSISPGQRETLRNAARPTARTFTWKHRDRDPGPYTTVDVTIGKRKVQLTESPTGRTFHVHVNGVRYVPADD
jgi:hypothetical protein